MDLWLDKRGGKWVCVDHSIDRSLDERYDLMDLTNELTHKCL